MKEHQRRRRIGRPPQSGPEAEANPFFAKNQEERRTLILETAARLFETKGYASTSVEDITDGLGVTKGVFYYYWKNKKEIIQEIHNRALSLTNEGLDRVLAEDRAPGDRVKAAIKNHIEAVMQNKSLVAVLLGDFVYSDETLEQRRSYTRRFQRIVEEGIAAGVVRDLDPQIVTFAIVGLCNSIAQWYRPAGRLSPEEVEDIYMEFMTHGYFDPPKGSSQA